MSLPRTLSAPVDHELVVKRSRFLAHVAPVTDGAAADDVVTRRRKQHWDARHHCVAVVLGARADGRRSSDDGEPTGTAGVPMLEVLRHRQMTDVVAVVTRYFGGVLLGAGGLVRAYSGAVTAALDAAERRRLIVGRRTLVEVTLDAPHAEAGRLEHLLREWAGTHDAAVGDTAYADQARLTVLVPPEKVSRLADDVAAATAGRLSPVVGDERIVDVPT
ncbi:putative YigZ family protein [Isoptericola sp. CG 20/1183]|uniref:YigZ family protein n=1 Tax=Isoptericola halotolerans TaxID=300560 RepID=A0ABX5ED83_9MICO|nr:MULTISPECIES: YigZ family protein [Isoptericola]PRZ04513.1 putative YigZ family protein [Isoptericola halotolerans]PRZ04589.1 putative YigZ family protein [Isoptericola sp. CG 20/1183]